MNLSPYPLPARILDTIWQAYEDHAYVDFAFYSIPAEPFEELELHQQAALTGEKDFTSWADKVRHLWPDYVRDPNWPSTKPENMQSTAISVPEFLGRARGEDYQQANGFQYAFLEPPYGLSGTPEVGQQLCLILGTFLTEGQPQIRRWSTDWSGYFDAGNEGWGAFFWTILNPEHGWIAAIGASTTD